MKAKSLKELPILAQAMAVERSRKLSEYAAQRATEDRRDANLFAVAVGPIQALRNKPSANLAAPAIAPTARMRQRDEASVLRESMSDAFTAASLLETDEHLSFLRDGAARDLLRKLRSGHWTVQRQLDLHGLRTDEAREALGRFLQQARRDELRCLRVIHGKGHGSPGKTPVLKSRVPAWLAQRQEVVAFVQARPVDGGSGALLVLLAAMKLGSRQKSGSVG